MSSRFISPFYDVGSGIKPPSGAKLFFFKIDGVTPKDTFSDQLATPTPNTNPVIADSFGVFGDIYITGAYKVDLQDKNGSQIYGGAIINELVVGSGQANNVLNRGTVAEIITDTSLSEGLAIKTSGYTTKDDDGGGTWDTVDDTTVTTNGLDIVQLTGVSGVAAVLRESPVMNIEMFGAVKDADSSAAIRRGISRRLSKGIVIPAKRYLYDGVVIANDFIKIIGEKMPTFKASFSGLKGGSIIEGTFSFTAKNVWLESFGVDLGTDTAAASGDGIKCTTTVDDGEHLHIENLIALGKNPSDPFHALLFESYQTVTGGNIIGINNFFSCVVKCQNMNLRGVYGYNSEKRGLFFKSDALFGKTNKINLSQLIVDGNGQPGQGLYIQTDGAQIENINISQVLIDGYPSGVELNDTAIGVGINQIKMSDMTLLNCSGTALFLNVANTFAKDIQISNLTINNCEAAAILTNGFVAHFLATNVFINYKTGTLDAVLDEAVKFVSSVLRTTINNIVITRNFATDEASLGAINYENQATVTPENNIISNRLCRIKGLGVPQNGLSILTGTPTTFTPADNKTAPKHTIITQLTAGTTITRIENERYPGVQFETGAILAIINESNQILRLDHDPSNFIRNKGSVQVVLGGTDAAHYTMSNTGIWTEL